MNYSILNCERRNGSTLAIASEASQVLGNAVCGVCSESCTTTDRIARVEEPAKHRVSDSLRGLLRRLRCTCSCYFSNSVFLRRLHLSLLEPLHHSPFASSPRAETVICRLTALSAYHRLAFPGLSNYISFRDYENFIRLCSRMFSPCRSRGS